MFCDAHLLYDGVYDAKSVNCLGLVLVVSFLPAQFIFGILQDCDDSFFGIWIV